MFTLCGLQGRHISGVALGGRLQLPQRDVQVCSPRQNHRSLDEVLELSHIPGPMPADQRLHNFRGDGLNTLIHPLRVLLDEIVDQDGNVLGALPKGRDEDGLPYTMAWVRHHDKYEKTAVLAAS